MAVVRMTVPWHRAVIPAHSLDSNGDSDCNGDCNGVGDGNSDGNGDGDGSW